MVRLAAAKKKNHAICIAVWQSAAIMIK